MTVVRLHYTRRKRGKLFWEPTPEMKAKGFQAKPLGDDGPEARAEALRLYATWLKAKDETPKVTDYPPGSFGAFYDRFRGKSGKPALRWSQMAPRSRDDYYRAWAYIDAWRPGEGRPALSHTIITQISTELCEGFYAHMAESHSSSERYRTVKCLKILLADAVVRMRMDHASPAAKLQNPQSKGRSQIWLGAEIVKLWEVAEIAGYHGMSIAIRIAWDTLFSPVDVWSVASCQIKQDAAGRYIERERTKTTKAAFGALSPETAAALDDYIANLGFDLTPESPVIRQRNGHAYRSKDTFGDDFRAVRSIAFPGDTRMFLDIRRSGNVEADAAGADKATMGEILANGLADSRFLDETYTPPTVTKAREVAKQRLEGRTLLAGEATRQRSK